MKRHSKLDEVIPTFESEEEYVPYELRVLCKLEKKGLTKKWQEVQI